MPKYAKGDYVVHPGQGVCVVEGIVPVAYPDGQEGTDGSSSRLMYEMYPVSGSRMRICFPVDNESALRRPVGTREARKLIAQMPQLEDDTFDDRHSWAMEEHFMLGLRNGDCRDALQVLKTMYDRLHAACPRGKKPPVCYGRIYKAAHERVTCELGLALNVGPDEVDRLIEESFRAA